MMKKYIDPQTVIEEESFRFSADITVDHGKLKNFHQDFPDYDDGTDGNNKMGHLLEFVESPVGEKDFDKVPQQQDTPFVNR